MKAGTMELQKFKRLQRRLKLTRTGTAGVLEVLWQETARNCPDGAIGRFSNEDIAIMVDWEGDPDDLVNALVDTGWLDRSARWRLTVHDWKDHCPSYIRGVLKRYGREFASGGEEPPIGASSEEPPNSSLLKGESAASSEEPTSYPILSNPNLSYSLRITDDEPPTAPPSAKTKRKRTSLTPVADSPPTLEEVQEYFESKRLHGDPLHFLAHHTMLGWRLKDGRPIVNWKAACVTWSKQSSRFDSPNGSSNSHKPVPVNERTRYIG